jgi:hypothetical protein
MDTQSQQSWNALTAQDQALFRENAATALARRGTHFIQAKRAMWANWLLSGMLGLFGMFVLGWSSTSAAVLLIAGFWLGWLADLVLRLFRSDALAISYQHAGDDLWFWQTVAILRGKRKQAPDAARQPSVSLSLIVDLVAGGTATLLALNAFADAGADIGDVLRSPSMLISIASMAIFGVAPSLWTRMRRADDGSIQLPVFCAGQRGIGLLVLVFALTGFGGGRLSTTILMQVTYGFFLTMASIELLWGIPELIREGEWVKHLGSEQVHSPKAD